MEQTCSRDDADSLTGRGYIGKRSAFGGTDAVCAAHGTLEARESSDDEFLLQPWLDFQQIETSLPRPVSALFAFRDDPFHSLLFRQIEQGPSFAFHIGS